ncbi:MAG: hypothetical protein ACXAAH_11740 [Promethearchaeota archaeon]|jgi:uncharacterized coiled-coil DUF342 family protein
MLTKEDDINKKIQIVKDILDNVYEILSLFKPLMDKMLKMDDAHQYKVNGTFKRAATLFGEISDLCKEIENNSLPPNTFLESSGN